MSFSESLTVRILGDSSGLRRELDDVVRQVGNLQDRLAGLSSSGDRLGRSLGGVANAISPLQQISQWLARITQQVQGLGKTPVNINVQPAIQALQQLIAAAQAAATMLRTISTGPAGLPIPAIPESSPAAGRVPRMAAGGLVTGPPGLDRVATMLTAGEFVLNQSAVERLGMTVLQDLNSRTRLSRESLPSSGSFPGLQQTVAPLVGINMNPVITPVSPQSVSPAHTTPVSPPRYPGVSPGASATTNNHFGGITIQVRETADVNSLIRDLRVQGIQLRNRRG